MFCLAVFCDASWSFKKDQTFEANCQSPVTLLKEGKYVAGSTCDFSCKAGHYRVSGNTKVSCLITGKWDKPPLECRGNVPIFVVLIWMTQWQIKPYNYLLISLHQ